MGKKLCLQAMGRDKADSTARGADGWEMLHGSSQRELAEVIQAHSIELGT